MTSTAASELLGRDEELAAIDRALEDGPRSGASLALAGEPGIGKTALLAAARGPAGAAGALVLSAVGVEAEAHFPFAGLHQLLEPVLPRIDGLAEEERLALLVALGMADGPAPDLFLISRAVLELLRAEAACRPVVMLVDDVQWLDPPTHACVLYLARRVAEVPLCLLGTVRVESVDQPVPFVDAALTQVTVGRLDDTTARALLERSATALPPADRVKIQQVAQGNPLALMELPTAWQGGSADDAPAKLPRRLELDFGGRVEGLPAATRDILLVAAVDERSDAAEVLAAASALYGHPLQAADLDAARDAGLLTAQTDIVQFRHPLVRSGILQTERTARIQAAHAAVAQTVAGEPYRRAWHRAQAIVGPDDQVADELEETVEDSLRRGAVMTAIGSLERAAQLSGASSKRGHRLLRAAEQAFSVGRVDLVDRLVREASTTNLDDLDWARMQWLREIFNDGVPGDATRVLELCDIAVRSATSGDQDLALNLLLGAALRCWWADTGPVARARVAAVLDDLADPNDPRTIAALAVAEPVLRAADVTDALARMPVDEIEDADTLRLLGMAAHAIGDSPRSDDYLDACENKLRAQHRLGVLVHALSMHVIVSLELGDWDRAAADSAEAIALAEETGQPIWTTGSLVCEAIARGLRGDADRALELVVEVEISAYRNRLNDLLSCAQLARGIAGLNQGHTHSAFEALLRMFEPTDPAYHQRECFGGLMFLAEAAAATGREDEAQPVLEQLEQVATVTPTPILTVNLAYARAVLASEAEAEPLFLDALAQDLGRWPWVRARTELAYGSWLVRRGRGLEAEGLLTSALTTMSRIGAEHWAAMARSELATVVDGATR